MRLIDADAAIDALESKAYRHTYLDQIVEIIKDLPSAQPKKGKWVRITKQHKDDEQEYSYYEISCSECGAIRKIGWRDARFCPNCGARMEDEDEID